LLSSHDITVIAVLYTINDTCQQIRNDSTWTKYRDAHNDHRSGRDQMHSRVLFPYSNIKQGMESAALRQINQLTIWAFCYFIKEDD